MSPTEMQLRRDKGLCYFCDDKFSFTHKCPNKRLLMLHIDEDNDLDSETKSPKSLGAQGESEQGFVTL